VSTAANRLSVAWASCTARLDALPDRDRHMLLIGVLAVLVAADLMLVQPVSVKRQAVLAAADEQARSAQIETERAAQALAQSRNELDAQAAQLDAELRRLGTERPDGEPLARLLRRVLARRDVSVVSLRNLDVVEVDFGGSSTAEAASAPDGERGRRLYMHRLELTLGGRADTLVAAVAALDRHAKPLRIERVRLLAAQEPEIRQRAVLTLAVLGTERTWLAL
jgi:hypothetical protein